MDQQDERFWSKVEKTTDGCWLWQGGMYSNGYGQFALGGTPRRTALAHRMAYEQCVGPIPQGKDLDHLCRVRHCVNPEHLEPVTRSENLLRSPIMGQGNRLETHCKQGHERSTENVYIVKGTRQCRVCRRATKQALRANPAFRARERLADAAVHRAARTRARGGQPAAPNATKTHCPQGHAYAGENLYVVPSTGARKCQTCLRAVQARAYHKRRKAVTDARPAPQAPQYG